MTLYEQYTATRDRHEANLRMDEVWRLGGFVLNVRQDYARVTMHDPSIGAWEPLYYLPEVDPVTMKLTGGKKIYRQDYACIAMRPKVQIGPAVDFAEIQNPTRWD